MPEFVLYLIGVAGAMVAFLAPLEVAFGAVIVFWLLFPGLLSLPGLPHVLPVDRLVLYLFAIRLLLRMGRPGEPGRDAYRFTLVHLGVLLVVLVNFLDGVFLASPRTYFPSDMDGWFSALDIAVFFVAALAVMRARGAWRAARIVFVSLLVTFGIAVIERITKQGWSHFLFEHLPNGINLPGGHPLGTRSGARVQVAAQFGLEYGWVVTMLVPLVVVATLRWARIGRWRSRVAFVFPVLAFLVVAFNQSRSADVAVGIGAFTFALMVGPDARLVRWGLLAVAGFALVAVAVPSIVSSPFQVAAGTNSTSIRIVRLGQEFSTVTGRAFQGLGNQGAINFVSIPGLDDSWATTYVTLGVIGLLARAVMLVIGMVAAARSLRARRGSDLRLLGAAALVGLALATAGGFFYDFGIQSTWEVAFLLALAAAVSEHVPVRGGRRSRARLVLPLAGVGLGFVALALAPSTTTQLFYADTMSPGIAAVKPKPADPYIATTLTNTFCGIVGEPALALPGNRVTCQSVADTTLWPPSAEITIQGPDAAAVHSQALRLFTWVAPAALHNVPTSPGRVGGLWVESDATSGKPGWATTAPLWVGVLGAAVALVVPPLRRRDEDSESVATSKARRPALV